MTTVSGKGSKSTTVHERMSSVEADVRHLDDRLESLATEQREGFASIRRALEHERQPITAFAGWASVILALVYAFGSPLQSMDQRHQNRIDLLEKRELSNAHLRGEAAQKFATLIERILALERFAYGDNTATDRDTDRR